MDLSEFEGLCIGMSIHWSDGGIGTVEGHDEILNSYSIRWTRANGIVDDTQHHGYSDDFIRNSWSYITEISGTLRTDKHKKKKTLRSWVLK